MKVIDYLVEVINNTDELTIEEKSYAVDNLERMEVISKTDKYAYLEKDIKILAIKATLTNTFTWPDDEITYWGNLHSKLNYDD